MEWEAIAAAVIGLGAIAFVLEPLFRRRTRPRQPFDPGDPEETPRGAALAALKEIEFDRATGKLSDTDYQSLLATYTARALDALREDASTAPAPDDIEALVAAKVRALRSASASTPAGAPVCPTCGPRPEPDAIFCSKCGLRLGEPMPCGKCGATVPPAARYCERCGAGVAA